MGYNLPDDEQLRGETVIRSGHAPRGPHEVAIDASSAEDHDIALGSTIKVLFRGPTEEFTVVGTVGFGDSKDLGGTTGAYFDTGTAAAGPGPAGDVRLDRCQRRGRRQRRGADQAAGRGRCPTAPRR